MGLFTFLFKAGAFVYFIKWIKSTPNQRRQLNSSQPCKIVIKSVKDLLNAIPELNDWAGKNINAPYQTYTTGTTDEDKKFLLTIDLPGFKNQDINVVVNDDLRSLRVYGKTSGFIAPVPQREVNLEVPIPGDIDLGSLSAFFVDGVCRIEANKKGLGRRIFVNSTSCQQEKEYEKVF